jgi:hypothetical protein
MQTDTFLAKKHKKYFLFGNASPETIKKYIANQG